MAWENENQRELMFAEAFLKTAKEGSCIPHGQLELLEMIIKDGKSNKVWLAVDEDGSECQFNICPSRICGRWMIRYGKTKELPSGTIEKIIGRPLTWSDDAVEI